MSVATKKKELVGNFNNGGREWQPEGEPELIDVHWKQVGQQRYPKARELFITADAGGSNGYRSHVWKQQLQLLADKLELTIPVSHFPPGTSTWNKVEHSELNIERDAFRGDWNYVLRSRPPR